MDERRGTNPDEILEHLDVVAGSPSGDELAAIAVVLAAATDSRAEQLRGRRLAEGPSLWRRSERLATTDLGRGYPSEHD